MKVRSWKELILCLLCGGAIIAYGLKKLAEKDSNGITYILVAIIMLIRAVPDAISEEKHEENAFRAYAAQWYGRGQFGFFAPVMPWLGLLLLILDGILVMRLPIVSVVRVLAGLLLGAALLSVILYGIWQKRQLDGMDDEEQAQIKADYVIYERHKCQMQEDDRQRWGIFAPAVPLLGAAPVVIVFLLGMDTESTAINQISVLLICAGVVGLFLGNWWQAWRLEHWEKSGKTEQLSDDSEHHL